MPSRWYRFTEGACVELGIADPESHSASVIGDAMTPLQHPVTGEIVDSKSNYARINKRLGLEVVGNEKLSERKDSRPDTFTDAKILDGIYRAEAIMADPSKLRARQNENRERLYRAERLVNGN
jgi:hypothetical protein